MSLSERRAWLVCYDIADHARLSRVHSYWKKRAIAIQYSVFLAVGTRASIEMMVRGSLRLIDDRQDDVRVYPLPKRGFVTGVGALVHSAVVDLHGEGLGLLRVFSKLGTDRFELRHGRVITSNEDGPV